MRPAAFAIFTSCFLFLLSRLNNVFFGFQMFYFKTIKFKYVVFLTFIRLKSHVNKLVSFSENYTATALLNITDDITELMVQGESTALVLIDSSKVLVPMCFLQVHVDKV